MLHLTQNERDIVERVLHQQLPGLEVWAFGSRVHGRNLKPFSDLDLAIVGDDDLDSKSLAGLRIAFADSDLPFRVDLVTLHTLVDDFRRVIETEHEVVQQPG
jgi:predicted nucleotidyltransferase